MATPETPRPSTSRLDLSAGRLPADWTYLLDSYWGWSLDTGQLLGLIAGHWVQLLGLIAGHRTATMGPIAEHWAATGAECWTRPLDTGQLLELITGHWTATGTDHRPLDTGQLLGLIAGHWTATGADHRRWTATGADRRSGGRLLSVSLWRGGTNCILRTFNCGLPASSPVFFYAGSSKKTSVSWLSFNLRLTVIFFQRNKNTGSKQVSRTTPDTWADGTRKASDIKRKCEILEVPFRVFFRLPYKSTASTYYK